MKNVKGDVLHVYRMDTSVECKRAIPAANDNSQDKENTKEGDKAANAISNNSSNHLQHNTTCLGSIPKNPDRGV